MTIRTMKFDGALLERGFWLYVWRITQGAGIVLYVGRTGDSSSQFAASPFSRMSRHLDVREQAKGNTLYKQLTGAGFSPEKCQFEMFAVGPLWGEQQTMALHREYRDKAAALERALADRLREAGYRVIGMHPRVGVVDKGMLEAVFEKVVSQL